MRTPELRCQVCGGVCQPIELASNVAAWASVNNAIPVGLIHPLKDYPEGEMIGRHQMAWGFRSSLEDEYVLPSDRARVAAPLPRSIP